MLLCSATSVFAAMKTTDLSTKIYNVSSGIYIRWDKTSGANQYAVYRRIPGKTWQKIKTTGSNTVSFTDTSAKDGTRYQYSVRAVAKGKTAQAPKDGQGRYVLRLQQPLFLEYTTVKQTQANRTIRITWCYNLPWSPSWNPGYKSFPGAGYQMRWAYNKNFTGAKYYMLKTDSRGCASQNITIPKNKDIYVQARGYKNINGKTYYGAWSRDNFVYAKYSGMSIK